MNDAFTSGRRIALVANTGWNIVRFRGVLIEDLAKRGYDVVGDRRFQFL